MSASAGNGADKGAAAGNGADKGAAAGNGADKGAAAGNGADGAISPTAVTGKNGARRADGPPDEPADRAHVPAGVLDAMRVQVADFAEFAHRSRVPSLPDLLALGSGGGITAEVVRTIAGELTSSQIVPGLGSDARNLTDSLMLALVAPRQPGQLTEQQLDSFVTVRGRLVVDVSTAAAGGPAPVTRLVRLDAPAPAAEPAGGADTAVRPDGQAAVIVGSAAAIAGERLYLSPESLLAYARRKVFRLCSSADDPQTAGSAIRAARNLEIVVLLDQTLGGGLWVDVDPETGQPAAALAIELSAPPVTIRFTHVPLRETPQLLSLPARLASG